MWAKREWHEVFNVLRGKKKTETNKHQLRILYPVRLSFISLGEMKTFLNKQILRECVASRPALQERLKEILQRQEK